MIIDQISNAATYSGLGGQIQKALGFLAATDFLAMAPGRYDIDGDEMFALVQDYVTRPRGDVLWEAHRSYIDVQFIVSGEEMLGYGELSAMQASVPYDATKDCLRAVGEGSFVRALPGTFLIFYPQDVHMPGVMASRAQAVRKVVVKVRCPGPSAV